MGQIHVVESWAASLGESLPTERVPSVDILGTPVARIERAEALAFIERLADGERPALVAFANAHTLNVAYRDRHFRSVLRDAALVLNDGIGVKLAGLMLRSRFSDNLNGSDLLPEVLAVAQRRGWRVYLLGGRPGVAERAGELLKRRVPGLEICGTRNGFFSQEETPGVLSAIRQARTDLLLVAMGNPRQELWLARHLEHTGAGLGVGTGAFLDFQAGAVRRAPRWMNRLGVEWLFRLAQEPSRLASRYLVGNPLFLGRIVLQVAGFGPRTRAAVPPSAPLRIAAATDVAPRARQASVVRQLHASTTAD